MSARKAYISSLGTTGLLVAAALAMLVVVGALVAFDRWPYQAVAEAEAVPVASDGSQAIHRASEPRPRDLGQGLPDARMWAVSASRSDALLRAAAADAGRHSEHAAPGASAHGVSDPVVSDLPAPDSSGTGAPAASQPAPNAPQAPVANRPRPPAILPPGTVTPSPGDTIDGVTGSVGGTVGTVDPQLGQTVQSTGSATADTVDGLLGG